LGFANSVKRGKIGIAAASGSGQQEVAVNIEKFGGGISQAFGTGGRDLSQEVGGITMLTALDYLASDPETDLILLLSKPPHPEVEKKILKRAEASQKPVVTCFLGRPAREASENIFYTRTLEAAALAAVSISQGKEPKFKDFTVKNVEDLIEKAASRLATKEKYIRGLYAGGTLCDEALDILYSKGINPWSNAGNKEERKIKDSSKSI
ncbi:MAG: FdrA family protein, partial [Elusimicrobia bacterium]|nr:FdrA family protein [Elusimicrobiota bacterium]